MIVPTQMPILDLDVAGHSNPRSLPSRRRVCLCGDLRGDPTNGQEAPRRGHLREDLANDPRQAVRCRCERGPHAFFQLGRFEIDRNLLERNLAVPLRPDDGRPVNAAFQLAEESNRRRAGDDEGEGTLAPPCKLIADALAERAARIESDDVSEEAMHVLVVLGPGALPGATPRRHAVHLLGDALNGLFCLDRAERRSELLDVLKQPLHLIRVVEEDGVELGER